MDEAVAGHAKLIEVSLDADGALTVKDDGRGMPVDPHPKFPGQVGARGHHDHAALGREVLRQGLRDLRRPARRRRLGGQRPVRASSRSPSGRTASSGARAFSRGKPTGPLRAARRHRASTAPQVRFLPDPVIFGEGVGVPPGAALPDGPLQGLPVPRRRDPLALRSRAHHATRPRPRRPSTSPTAWPTSWPRRSAGAETVTRALLRPHRAPGRERRRGGMGDRLDAGRLRRGRRLHVLLLQHRADARGRHPRGGPARRPDPRPEGLRRARRARSAARSSPPTTSWPRPAP